MGQKEVEEIDRDRVGKEQRNQKKGINRDTVWWRDKESCCLGPMRFDLEL